jgi:branched-subunit amino acid aminotransferase/4-amino-4-deoxychorismate lyase
MTRSTSSGEATPNPVVNTHASDGTAGAALIHSDDRAMMVDDLMQDVIGRGEAFDRDYRIVRHDDHAERWVHGLGKLELDAGGRPLTMRGTIQDLQAAVATSPSSYRPLRAGRRRDR